MKVTFTQAVLNEAVTLAISCVSMKSTLKSAEGVYIDCTGDRAIFVGYDLEKGIRIETDADIADKGACIIPAQNLSSIVKLLPAGLVTLEVTDTFRAKLSAGKAEFEINAMNPNEYSTLPDLTNDKGFHIKQSELKTMISQTLFAVAQNDSRAVFNGALFKMDGNRITTVGCDTFRLAVCERTCQLENETLTSDGEQVQFIVPGKTLNEVMKLLNEPEKSVRINLSRKQVIFRFDDRDVIFWSRLIEGDYIDYERIIPKNSNIFVSIDTASFENALVRAAIVSDESAGKNQSGTHCNFHDGKLELTSVSTNGKLRDEIPVTLDGGSIEIGFNCRYLIEALRASQCEKLKLSLSTPFISMVIEPLEPDGNGRFIFLVLPVKMSK